MPLNTVIAPTAEPVTVAEAKSSPSFRVDATRDDAAIASLLVVARGMAEGITRRALMQQTLELVLDGFPHDGILNEIVLPCPPLASVTSIKYIDTNGAEQTLASTEYTVDTSSEPGRVYPAFAKAWPGTRGVPNDVRVRYVAGYASAAHVPEEIKAWIRMRAGTLYDNPQAVVVGQTVESVPKDFIDGLLDDWRVPAFR